MSRNRFTMPSSRPASRRQSFRPRCEPLETRWVLTTVTNLNDSGPGSLRQAILDTAPGETVDFQAGLTGTIALTTGELAIQKDLVINGADASLITVSGNGRSRVFRIAAGFNVEMYGLTIRDGSVQGTGATGGGILNQGYLLLYGSNVINNRASSPASPSGGGIRNTGTLYVFYTAIGNNSTSALGTAGAFSSGGGISNAGDLYMQDSVVSANRASAQGTQSGSTSGGGISNSGTLTVIRSILRDNTLSGTGRAGSSVGAGLVNTGTTATAAVIDSAVVNNTATSGGTSSAGGGIGVSGGTVTVSNSTISGNTAIITRVVTSGAFGGGVAVGIGNLNITSSTITANTVVGMGQATLQGGGLALNLGTAALRNTIVAGNTAQESPDVLGDVASEGYNLIGNTEGGSGFSATDLLGVDPLLGPLQDNGGYTLTHALLPGSPALDAGDPFAAPEWDQRGEGYSRIAGMNIDIGAFEVQNPSPHTGKGRMPLDPGALAVLQQGGELARPLAALPGASNQPGDVPPDAAADLLDKAWADMHSRAPGRPVPESRETGSGEAGRPCDDAFSQVLGGTDANLIL